jgi:outer membrane protein assembly factor BamB
MSRPLTLLVLLALVFGVSNSASGGDGNWPQWRGADMSGVAADDPALPEKWSPTENVAWKTPIPGLGWSSPIVWGDRVFVTAVSAEVDGEAPRKGMYLPNNATKNASGKHVWKVYCVDLATGKIRWERTAHDGPAPSTRHPKNSFASETPITDG